ncbi:MAG: protein kinase family protein with domain [Acidimicrobiales bacterium]|nr:protein kinase family protein with domain [Acidimicrobiales bacterium]
MARPVGSGAVDRVLSERYELERHVARGGMADIYLGRDRRLGREVAVKVLRPELSADDEYIDRFRDEARAAAQLNHPNIVSVFDWGSDGGDAYIVMEWVDGPTLAEVLRAEAPLAVDRAAHIGADIAAGLSYAHAKGVVHRDVKPSNVLLAPTGNAKVADFGIAKMPERSTVQTNPGVVLGTPAYLSPEQLKGQSADPRSDVYGLGAVLYEMVTAHKPFSGDTPAEVAGNVLHHRPPRPSGINPAVPAAFEGILSKALARDPADRYRDANELRVDLLDFADGGRPVPEDETVAFAADVPSDSTRAMAVAAPEPAVVAGPPPRRRRTAEAWLIGVILALAVLAVIIALVASSGGGGGGKVTVPAVTNLSQNDAIARLQRANLNPVPVPQSDPSIKAGNVIFTDPQAGTKVNKNSDVKLFVSSGPTTTTRRVTTTRPTVTVPATTSPPTSEAPTTPTTSSSATTSPSVTVSVP